MSMSRIAGLGIVLVLWGCGTDSMPRDGLTSGQSAATTVTYRVVDLGPAVYPRDINASGTVVGYQNVDYTRSAVVYDPSTGVLQTISGARSANAINGAGVIAGTTDSGAFLYRDGALTYLGDDYSADGLSDAGQIAGSKANDNPYQLSPLPTNPAIYDLGAGNWSELDVADVYSRGTVEGAYADLFTLLDINDEGYAVGNYRKAGLTTHYAFMVTPAFDQVLTPIPGSDSLAHAINADGFVVGATVFDSLVYEYNEAYLYDVSTGDVVNLGRLNGGYYSIAMDLNRLNEVVGYYATPTAPTSLGFPDKYHAFVWRDGVMTDLNDLLPADSGWILNMAYAINDDGVVVGDGLLDGVAHGFMLLRDGEEPVPVEEPKPPVANASVDPLSGIVPLTVKADASASYDPDGTVVAYAWDFGDGTSSDAVVVEHTYRSQGTYTATLTVTDDQGLQDSVSFVVDVLPKRSRR